MNTRLAKLFFLGGALMTALGVVNYFSFYPVRITANEPQVFGEPLLRNSGADVALIVDTAIIRKAGQSGRFSETDWSYGWMNLLLQEEKQFDILDVNSNPNLGAYQLAVFTASAAQKKNVKRLVNDCPRVILETPPPRLCQALSIPPANHLQQKTTTWLNAYRMYVTAAAALPESYTPLLSQDSLVFVGSVVSGSTEYVVVTLNVGTLCVSIQQGVPNDDFSVSPRVTKKTGAYPLVSGDLVSDSAYYQRLIPFFDIFEHDLWSAISGSRARKPLIADSPHGAFIMSHDEEGMGDLASWLAEQEQRWNVTSATLVTPAAISKHGLQRISSAGGEIGLHVDKYSYFARPGLPGLRPFEVEIPLAEQKKTMENLAGKEITINRNHWLLWTDHYTKTLRELAAAGVKLDLSYGPLGDGLAGYIFGTAFPFVPLDTNGFPLPILELPFLYQDDERFHPEYLDSALDTSLFQEEIVNVIYHANTMALQPDTLVMWGWRESFNRAKQAGLPILRYGDILELLRDADATIPGQLK